VVVMGLMNYMLHIQTKGGLDDDGKRLRQCSDKILHSLFCIVDAGVSIIYVTDLLKLGFIFH
jgi:hypothetical protein